MITAEDSGAWNKEVIVVRSGQILGTSKEEKTRCDGERDMRRKNSRAMPSFYLSYSLRCGRWDKILGG